MRTKNEIDEELGRATEWVVAGVTEFSGMTYEQGVEAALRWVLMEEDERPIEQDFSEENN